jgi:hypothetical protein
VATSVQVRAGAAKPTYLNAKSNGYLPELIDRLGLLTPNADIVSELVAKDQVELGRRPMRWGPVRSGSQPIGAQLSSNVLPERVLPRHRVGSVRSSIPHQPP